MRILSLSPTLLARGSPGEPVQTVTRHLDAFRGPGTAILGGEETTFEEATRGLCGRGAALSSNSLLRIPALPPCARRRRLSDRRGHTLFGSRRCQRDDSQLLPGGGLTFYLTPFFEVLALFNLFACLRTNRTFNGSDHHQHRAPCPGLSRVAYRSALIRCPVPRSHGEVVGALRLS